MRRGSHLEVVDVAINRWRFATSTCELQTILEDNWVKLVIVLKIVNQFSYFNVSINKPNQSSL